MAATGHVGSKRAVIAGRAIVVLPPLFFLLLLAPAPGAQESTGALEGRVFSNEVAAAPQAGVKVTGPSLQGPRSAVSDERGRFRVPLLPVGAYTVRISALGYRPVTLTDVTVQLGHTTSLGDVRLEIEPIQVSETVVTAGRARLDPRSTVIGGNLSRETLRALPTDRDYLSIVALLPHANVSYFGDRTNLLGTSGPESRSIVDGVDVVEPPGNAGSTSLPYNFVREIQVLEGGYEAEYGGAGGGIVNAVTASGGNELHGQAFGFFADRQLTSTGSVLSVPRNAREYASWDAGLAVGGALARDRLWFYAAYNPTVERLEIALPGFGTADDLRQSHRFAGKLSWRAAEGTNVVLTGLGDPTDRDQVGGEVLLRTASLGNIDPVLGNQRGGGTHLSLRVTHILTPRSFLDLVLARSDSRSSLTPRTARGRSEPLYVDTRTGYVEGGFGSFREGDAGRTSIRASFSYDWNQHSLKAGGGYEGEFFHDLTRLDQVQRFGDSLYTRIELDDRRSSNHMRSPSAFVQDSWRVTDRMRINLGLRWSGEFWMASGGSVGQRILDQWQPRLGATWTPDPDRRSKLFASYGRFDQKTRLNVPQYFLQDRSSIYTVRSYNHDPRIDPSGGTLGFAQILGHQPEVHGLHGAGFDELELGYERVLGSFHAVARGIYRRQRDAIVAAYSASLGQAVYGNPGRGELAAYPKIERTYRALELTVERAVGSTTTLSASYVVSRNRGNYEGYWDQSAGVNDPLGGGAFMPTPAAAINSSGPLPNDRTHVLKCYASQKLLYGLDAGVTLTWASGTPLSEFGSTPFGAPYYLLLEPRGSQGRSPRIYDHSARLSYLPEWSRLPAGVRPRFLLDAYHIGNPRRAVFVDQVRYLAGSTPNPAYGKPVLLQPPVAYRLGVEINW